MRRVPAISLLLLVGCATATRGSSRDTWRELSSAHFTVRTDLSAADARQASDYLEQSRAALVAVFGPRSDRPQAAPIEVTVYADGLEFERLFGRRLSGLYVRTDFPSRIFLYGPPSTWDKRSTLAVEGHRSVLKHEMTHALAAGVYLRQPRWFAEGLAQFLETFEIAPDGRSAIFGIANLGSLQEYNRYRSVSVTDALSWDHVAADSQMSDGEVFGHYGISWVLVHWFFNTHLKEFGALQEGLARGRMPALAWKVAMGGVDPASLDPVLNQYVKHGDYQVFTLPILPSGGPVKERTLGAEEVELVRAHTAFVAAGTNPSERDARLAEGSELLAKVLAKDPSNVAALSQQRYPSPAAKHDAARRAVAAHPEDAAAWRMLSMSLAPGPERNEALRKSLELGPNDPVMLNNLAWAELQEGQAAAALLKAQRAADYVPWDPNFSDTLAAILAQLHRCPEAILTEERALDLLPEHLTPAGRAHYEKRLEKMRTDCRYGPVLRVV